MDARLVQKLLKPTAEDRKIAAIIREDADVYDAIEAWALARRMGRAGANLTLIERLEYLETLAEQRYADEREEREAEERLAAEEEIYA